MESAKVLEFANANLDSLDSIALLPSNASMEYLFAIPPIVLAMEEELAILSLNCLANAMTDTQETFAKLFDVMEQDSQQVATPENAMLLPIAAVILDGTELIVEIPSAIHLASMESVPVQTLALVTLVGLNAKIKSLSADVTKTNA
jgi:hypothetical protein